MSKRALSRSTPATPAGTSIIGDPLEIRRLLARGAEGHTAVTVKVRGSETVLKSRMIDVDPRQEGVQLKFGTEEGELNPEALQDAMQTGSSRECMVLVYLPGRSIIGLHLEPSEVRKDRVVFAFPEKLFKIQRRRDVRFEIPQAYEFTVEFESIEQARLRIRKRLIDISESGLSFFVLSPREAALFRPGLIIPRCVVQIHNQRLEMTIRICNHARYDRGAQGAGNKVGVEFEEISPEDRNYIAQFVYSHAQHLFY